MKPYLHGLISVKKFGGKAEDYYEVELGDLSYWEGNMGDGTYDTVKVTAKQNKALDKFANFLSSTIGEDLAQRVFGECAKVIITRDGKIKSDYVDHD